MAEEGTQTNAMPETKVLGMPKTLSTITMSCVSFWFPVVFCFLQMGGLWICMQRKAKTSPPALACFNVLQILIG